MESLAFLTAGYLNLKMLSGMTRHRRRPSFLQTTLFPRITFQETLSPNLSCRGGRLTLFPVINCNFNVAGFNIDR